MKAFFTHTAPYKTPEAAEAGRIAKAKLIRATADSLRSAADALAEIADSGVSDSTMTHVANTILETL
jgi:hypothetical protein